MPAPRANFVQLVINGESWGVYANDEQFNKDFLSDNFCVRRACGGRFPVAFGGSGGLTDWKMMWPCSRSYELKSDDTPKAWAA